MALMIPIWGHVRERFAEPTLRLGLTEYNDSLVSGDRSPLYWSAWRNPVFSLGLSFYMSLEEPVFVGCELSYPAEVPAVSVKGSWYTARRRKKLVQIVERLHGFSPAVTECLDLDALTPERGVLIVDEYVNALENVAGQLGDVLESLRSALD